MEKEGEREGERSGWKGLEGPGKELAQPRLYTAVIPALAQLRQGGQE